MMARRTEVSARTAQVNHQTLKPQPVREGWNTIEPQFARVHATDRQKSAHQRRKGLVRAVIPEQSPGRPTASLGGTTNAGAVESPKETLI